MLIYEETLTEISRERFEEIQTKMLDYQINNEISADIIKIRRSPKNRGLAIWGADEIDVATIKSIIEVIDPSLRLFVPNSPENNDITNKVILFLPPSIKHTLDRGSLKKLIALSSRHITMDDIHVCAPPKVLDNGTVLISYRMSHTALTVLRDKGWRLNLCSRSITLQPARDIHELAAERLTKALSLTEKPRD